MGFFFEKKRENSFDTLNIKVLRTLTDLFIFFLSASTIRHPSTTISKPRWGIVKIKNIHVLNFKHKSVIWSAVLDAPFVFLMSSVTVYGAAASEIPHKTKARLGFRGFAKPVWDLWEGQCVTFESPDAWGEGGGRCPETTSRSWHSRCPKLFLSCYT